MWGPKARCGFIMVKPDRALIFPRFIVRIIFVVLSIVGDVAIVIKMLVVTSPLLRFDNLVSKCS